jgi:hypothetical protein
VLIVQAGLACLRRELEERYYTRPVASPHCVTLTIRFIQIIGQSKIMVTGITALCDERQGGGSAKRENAAGSESGESIHLDLIFGRFEPWSPLPRGDQNLV